MFESFPALAERHYQMRQSLQAGESDWRQRSGAVEVRESHKIASANLATADRLARHLELQAIKSARICSDAMMAMVKQWHRSPSVQKIHPPDVAARWLRRRVLIYLRR